MRTRRIAIVTMAALAAVSLMAATACEQEEQPVAQNYTVSYLPGADDATGTAPKAQTYAEGEEVVLAAATTFAREDYTFTAWSDGTTEYEAASSFLMPAHDVTLTAVWEENAQLPEGTVVAGQLPESALKTVNGNATAVWQAEYASDAFKLIAWVQDAKVFDGGTIYQNDGVTVYFNKRERARGFTEKTLVFQADAKGNKSLKYAASGSDKISAAAAESVRFSLDGKTVAGYRITLSLPYTDLGVTAAEKNVSVAVGLNNASNAGDLTTVYDPTFGMNYVNVHTYAAVTDNNTFAQNPDVLYGAHFGDGGTLAGSASWNIDGDTAENGIVTLAEDDGADNNLYLHSSNHKEEYVEMKFNATGVIKTVNDDGTTEYDPFPKFGISLTSADGAKKTFFYINSASNTYFGSGAYRGKINETAIDLEWAMQTNGAWRWTDEKVGTVGETSNVYQGENYVTLGVYRNGSVLKFYCNGGYVATVTSNIGADEDAWFGVTSIKMGLNVKDASVKTDGLENYRKAEELDVLLLGDDYLAPGNFTHYRGMFEGKKTADLAANGMTAEDVAEQLDEIGERYKPAHIVLNVGLNDINDRNTSDQKVIEGLTAIFGKLHTLFPDAQIVYIGMADNPAFHSHAGEYEAVNTAVRAIDYVEYLDLPAALTATEGKPDDHWFSNGVVLSTNGYGVLADLLAEKVGVEYGTQDGLGILDLGEATVGYTGGWKYDEAEGAWRNRGYGDSQLFITGSYGETVYAKAEVSIRAALNGEEAGKTGLYIQSDKIGYFFYINNGVRTDLNAYGSWNDHYAAVAYRHLQTNDNDWVFPETPREEGYFTPFASQNGGTAGENGYADTGSALFDYNADPENFITLELVKKGNLVYFFAGGTYVGGTAVTTEFAENDKVSVSVYTFNMDIYAKGGASSIVPEEVSRHMIPEGSDHLIDGSLDDWTAEEKSNPKTIVVNDNRQVTLYATLGEYGVSIFYDVYHNVYNTTGIAADGSSSKWHATNAEFRLNGDTSQRAVHANGVRTGGVTDFKFVNETVDDESIFNGKQHTQVEIFVNYSLIPDASKEMKEMCAAFFWRTTDELGKTAFSTEDKEYNWWNLSLMRTMGEGQQYYITHEGFLHAEDEEIDGVVDTTSGAWATCTPTTKKWTNDASQKEVVSRGFLGTDGIYYSLVATFDTSHRLLRTDIENYVKSDLVSNVEFQGEFGNAWYPFLSSMSQGDRILFFRDQLQYTPHIDQVGWNIEWTEDGSKMTTLTLEIFIAYEHTTGGWDTAETKNLRVIGDWYNLPLKGEGNPTGTGHTIFTDGGTYLLTLKRYTPAG